MRQIYERDSAQSTEVLLNFSIRTFMRMSGNWNSDDTAATIQEKVKHGKVETINRVMGSDEWLSIVTNPSLDKTQREDAIISMYVQRLRGFFRYA